MARELGASLGCDPDIVDSAALAHDLGHPPFGHNGEAALDAVADKCGGFEGNAQTLRLLSRLEGKTFAPDGHSVGLNLTRATLAACIKYPWLRGDGPRAPPRKFGVYADDADIFACVVDGAQERVAGRSRPRSWTSPMTSRTRFTTWRTASSAGGSPLTRLNSTSTAPRSGGRLVRRRDQPASVARGAGAPGGDAGVAARPARRHARVAGRAEEPDQRTDRTIRHRGEGRDRRGVGERATRRYNAHLEVPEHPRRNHRIEVRRGALHHAISRSDRGTGRLSATSSPAWWKRWWPPKEGRWMRNFVPISRPPPTTPRACASSSTRSRASPTSRLPRGLHGCSRWPDTWRA